MDYLKSLLILGKVLDSGSLSAVAKELDISPSAVSQHIRQLEAYYKVKLLNRTTRKISPTPEGSLLWQGATTIAQQLDQTQRQLEQMQNAFSGEVRVNLPTGFLGSFAVQKFIQRIADELPHIELNLQLEDRVVDLMNGETDIAIRAAEPVPNSNVIARYLALWQLGIYASPDYLARNPVQKPADLQARRWIKYRDDIFNMAFNYLNLGNFSAGSVLNCPAIASAKTLAIQHQGLTFQLSGEVENDVQQGRLVRVLPDLPLPQYNIYAVTAHRSQSAKIGRVLEVLRECFGER